MKKRFIKALLTNPICLLSFSFSLSLSRFFGSDEPACAKETCKPTLNEWITVAASHLLVEEYFKWQWRSLHGGIQLISSFDVVLDLRDAQTSLQWNDIDFIVARFYFRSHLGNNNSSMKSSQLHILVRNYIFHVDSTPVITIGVTHSLFDMRCYRTLHLLDYE